MSKRPSRELNHDPILERILEQLKECGKTEKDMTKYLGIAESSFTEWKYGNRKTFLRYTGEMAEYFNVPVDYLLYGEEEGMGQKLSRMETKMVVMLRSMTQEQRECIVKTAELLAKNGEKY